jgi:hypothetical protein
MPSQNLNLGKTDRLTRFVPGWWILPGLVVSGAGWAAAIWLIAAR